MKNLQNNKITECFISDGVELPTGYFIGFSAATGDLSDNHEILSVDFYNMDTELDIPTYNTKQYFNIVPKAKHAKSPRPHIDGPPASSFSWRIFKRIALLLFILFLSSIGFMGIFWYLGKRAKEKRKRFY
uniref:Vesicular integral-membrane protein VIP36 (Trinotate prediction) n=1 Tax=Henneguya salminicola TaxID=69463 RepID=A0A6G3MME0_HENSL